MKGHNKKSYSKSLNYNAQKFIHFTVCFYSLNYLQLKKYNNGKKIDKLKFPPDKM